MKKRAITIHGFFVQPHLVWMGISSVCLIGAFILHEPGGGELAFPSAGELICFILGGLITIGGIAWLAFEIVLKGVLAVYTRLCSRNPAPFRVHN